MKSLKRMNSSSVICKSLRKGDAALAGCAGSGLLNVDKGLCAGAAAVALWPNIEDAGLAAIPGACVAGRAKRGAIEEFFVASGVWLWARRDENGRVAASLLEEKSEVALLEKAEVPVCPNVEPVCEPNVDAGLGLYKETGFSGAASVGFVF